MALWPFRAVLLPNAEASKKRLGSSPPLEASEKISPVVIEEGELKEAFSKVIAPRGIMIFTLLDIGFVSAAIKDGKDCTKLHNLKAYSCPRLLSGSQKLAKMTHDGNGTM